MTNFVIRLVQDFGHEADVTDEIAGMPVHFDRINEGREAGHKLQGRMKINRRRWKGVNIRSAAPIQFFRNASR